MRTRSLFLTAAVLLGMPGIVSSQQDSVTITGQLTWDDGTAVQDNRVRVYAVELVGGGYGVVQRFDVPHPTAEIDDQGNFTLLADRSFFAFLRRGSWMPTRSFVLKRRGSEGESWVEIVGTDGKTTVYTLPEEGAEVDLGKIVVISEGVPS